MSDTTTAAARTLRLLGAAGGARARDVAELDAVEVLRRGLPAGAFGRIASELDVPVGDLARWLGLSRRTLLRRQRRLSATESSRLYRLARLYTRASDVLAGPAAAARWLRRPQRALGGEVPLALLDTDAGALAVERLLGRVEDSVVT